MAILIVDDKEENRYFQEVLLKGNGFNVESVPNGAEALKKLESGKFELIISDILMPVMDGLELCRKVKTNKATCHIPFIIYTATYTGPQDEMLAGKVGADRFIVKPCEPETFMEAVRNLMAAAEQCAESSSPELLPQEKEVLKLYNERLIRKIEMKMLELEKEVGMRKETEEILRQSEEKYKSILDNIEDGYYEVDLAGNFTFFNKSMCRILGYSGSELMGMNNREYMDKENAQKVFQTFNQVFTTGKPARGLDWVLIKKDGTKCHIDNSVSLIKDADGKITGFRGIARDITEYKNAEKEKIRLTEQLQQAQKMEAMGSLAGGIAHDFNNLLSIILGYGEIVLGSLGKGHPLHEPLEQVYQSGVRAKELTRQLLAFGRKQVLETKVVHINSVVTGFEKLLRRLIGEHIQLNLKLTTESLTVKADVTQLEQVLMNLSLNARDAMPDGGVLTIETASVELDDYAEPKIGVPPGRYAMIGVNDTGFGMAKETLSHIFEPFFTTKGKEKGTGLGLATSYGIVRQHGGNIWVYSEPDHGTTFKIYFPICEESGAPAKTASLSLDTLQGSETILVVEDNEQVRDLAEAILRDQGYTVLTAENGNAALAILENYIGTVNLLLTDVIMPGMNGKDLFDQISKRYANMKVIYMSGYADDVVSYQGLLNKGVNFIQKPFMVKTFSAKVREVLDKNNSPS